MQRWLTILVGALAVALALVLAYRSIGARAPASETTAVHTDAGADALAVLESGTAPDGEPKAAELLADLTGGGVIDPRGELGAGWRLPDGRVPPRLPDGTPKQVRIGVVIMTFAGAQGAPPGARPKKDALDLATKLAADARADFHAAVVRGDSGSVDDVGHIPRGVLEAGTEYVAFTMPVGTVEGPLETPRGYWIIKRID